MQQTSVFTINSRYVANVVIEWDLAEWTGWKGRVLAELTEISRWIAFRNWSKDRNGRSKRTVKWKRQKFHYCTAPQSVVAKYCWLLDPNMRRGVIGARVQRVSRSSRAPCRDLVCRNFCWVSNTCSMTCSMIYFSCHLKRWHVWKF